MALQYTNHGAPVAHPSALMAAMTVRETARLVNETTDAFNEYGIPAEERSRREEEQLDALSAWAAAAQHARRLGLDPWAIELDAAPFPALLGAPASPPAPAAPRTGRRVAKTMEVA